MSGNVRSRMPVWLNDVPFRSARQAFRWLGMQPAEYQPLREVVRAEGKVTFVRAGRKYLIEKRNDQ